MFKYLIIKNTITGFTYSTVKIHNHKQTNAMHIVSAFNPIQF